MPANYNNSAWFYDGLQRMVYGRALINAQVYLLQFIPANSKILIAGGGTGQILEELTKLHSGGLQITYVEIAAGMICRSEKRKTGANQITFINNAIENVELTSDFDVLITPFFFDNFNDDTLGGIFAHIDKALKTSGIWLNTDFRLSGKWWQSVLLNAMFIFFKIICGIEASKLPAIDEQFKRYGFKIINEKSFFGDFVVSRVYRK